MITPTPKVYTVNELNNYVKGILDSDENLKYVYVTGEISNFKAHYSGHMYMTVKDEAASVKAVMFAGNASKLRFVPENGMKILALGTISLFPRDGSYQLYITAMQPDGAGALSIAFEQLKKKLEAEGLFSAEHKKPLPLFPRRVGVITSSTGAAVQDIFNVLGRRFPVAQVVVRSAKVQGEGAAQDIAAAIREFNEQNGADVLIVGRGGGSVEDLWAFNEEVVARAVYASSIPIISAVGHETDYTICDFVADLRAPTPSAAAEIAVPDIFELKSDLDAYKAHIYNVTKNIISAEKARLDAIQKSGALKDPVLKLQDNRRSLAYLEEKLTDITRNTLEISKNRLSSLAGKLDALSPLGVIARGYGIVNDDNGVVSSVKSIKKGDSVTIKLSDGSFGASVTEIYGE
ncbi:MAG: exodeoxyribonuclease VII large subunit [Clostridia bacterium]|nr:exodeoxyribonuclease VII large subunit [Clostridia bacterium]